MNGSSKEVVLVAVSAEEVGRAMAWCTPERALKVLAQVEWRYAPPQELHLRKPSRRQLLQHTRPAPPPRKLRS